MERLNKYLASCGAASRRGADKLIQDGRVRVNGKVVTELGTSVNPANDSVTVDGVRVKPVAEYTYIML